MPNKAFDTDDLVAANQFAACKYERNQFKASHRGHTRRVDSE